MTAMQQMIEMIESVRRDEPPTALWNLKKYAQELLATEKQQIIEAVDKTYDSTEYQKDGDGYLHCPFNGSDYYEQTFGNFPSPSK